MAAFRDADADSPSPLCYLADFSYERLPPGDARSAKQVFVENYESEGMLSQRDCLLTALRGAFEGRQLLASKRLRVCDALGFAIMEIPVRSDCSCKLATVASVIGGVLFLQLPILQMFAWIPWHVYLMALALALVVLYSLVAVCGLYPSWLATRVKPAEALQYE